MPRLKLIDLQSLHTLEVVIRGYPNRRHISWDTSALLSPQMLCSGRTVLAKSRMQHWEREKKRIEPVMNVPFCAAINFDLSSSVPTQWDRNCLFASVSQSIIETLSSATRNFNAPFHAYWVGTKVARYTMFVDLYLRCLSTSYDVPRGIYHKKENIAHYILWKEDG